MQAREGEAREGEAHQESVGRDDERVVLRGTLRQQLRLHRHSPVSRLGAVDVHLLVVVQLVPARPASTRTLLTLVVCSLSGREFSLPQQRRAAAYGRVAVEEAAGRVRDQQILHTHTHTHTHTHRHSEACIRLFALVSRQREIG